jgi:hypothetical protein
VKTIGVALVAVLACVGCSKTASPSEPTRSSATRLRPYVLMSHKVRPEKPYVDAQRDVYTVAHGDVLLTVLYDRSQVNTSAPGFSVIAPGVDTWKFLISHSYYHDPDLSQIPEVGGQIAECVTHPDETNGSQLIISRQPTSEPCMVRVGNELQYEPEPNAGRFDSVEFTIESETVAGAHPTQ